MILDADFPNLGREGFVEASPETARYNCIAWAASRQDDWWWPDRNAQYYWPQAVLREETIETFIQAFQTLGYVPCDSHQLENGFEKVALYALGGAPKHAARQLPDGRWTSKLGAFIDIEHTLAGLEGPRYGIVVQLLKRSVRGQA